MQGHSVTTVIFLSGSVILLKPVHAETMWCWFTLDVFFEFLRHLPQRNHSSADTKITEKKLTLQVGVW